MAHIRQQIRQALKTRLTGLATTGENVFNSRDYPLDDTELPGLLIKSGSEDAETLTLGTPAEQSRDYLVLIEARAKVKDDLDDVLDQICLEVEKAIAEDDTLGGLVSSGVVIASTSINTLSETEKPVGVASMYFRAKYYCFANTPDQAR